MEARCCKKNQTYAGNESIKQVKAEWNAYLDMTKQKN